MSRTGQRIVRTDHLRGCADNLKRCQGNLLRAREETRSLWRGRCAAVAAAGIHDDNFNGGAPRAARRVGSQRDPTHQRAKVVVICHTVFNS